MALTTRRATLGNTVGRIWCGAKNIKNIAKQLNGRAKSGIKALITDTQRYGADSKQVALVRNLYQGVISQATNNIVNRTFTSSVLKIAGCTVLLPAISSMASWLYDISQ